MPEALVQGFGKSLDVIRPVRLIKSTDGVREDRSGLSDGRSVDDGYHKSIRAFVWGSRPLQGESTGVIRQAVLFSDLVQLDMNADEL